MDRQTDKGNVTLIRKAVHSKVQMSGIPQVLLNKASHSSLCTESGGRVDSSLSISEAPGFRSFPVIGSRGRHNDNT
jgi:hypothetical protein